MAKNSGKRQPSPSVWNWMGSLLLYSIPGVNLIFLTLSVFLAKTTAKRNFAIAGLVLMLVSLLLVFIAFAVFPDFFARLTQTMRETVRQAPVGDVIVTA